MIPLDRPDSRATILIQIAHEAVRTKFKNSANELDQLGAFFEMVTMEQHQTGSHFQDIQHRFPDTYHSVIICLSKSKFSIRAHELEGAAFDTEMETGDILVFNRYWKTGLMCGDSKN